MKKIGKFFTGIIYALSVLFMLWVGVSWVDIIWDNTSPNPVHSKYNAFVMMVERSEGAK